MFSITPSEILVIVVVALIVFGPRRLIEVSRRAGQVAGQLRRTADELRAGLDDELRTIREPFEEATRPFREAQSDLAAAGKELIETADGELRWVDTPPPAGDEPADDADPAEPVEGETSPEGAAREAGEATEP